MHQTVVIIPLVSITQPSAFCYTCVTYVVLRKTFPTIFQLLFHN